MRGARTCLANSDSGDCDRRWSWSGALEGSPMKARKRDGHAVLQAQRANRARPRPGLGIPALSRDRSVEHSPALTVVDRLFGRKPDSTPPPTVAPRILTKARPEVVRPGFDGPQGRRPRDIISKALQAWEAGDAAAAERSSSGGSRLTLVLARWSRSRPRALWGLSGRAGSKGRCRSGSRTGDRSSDDSHHRGGGCRHHR